MSQHDMGLSEGVSEVKISPNYQRIYCTDMHASVTYGAIELVFSKTTGNDPFTNPVGQITREVLVHLDMSPETLLKIKNALDVVISQYQAHFSAIVPPPMPPETNDRKAG